MLAGFLTVLKIIGIILLVILAVILLVLLLVLFVPVRYKLDGTVPETYLDEGFDIEKIRASAKFSWLLHFVSGGIEFPENKEFTVKILGIKILPRPEKKSGKKVNEEKDKENDSESDTNTRIDYEEKSDMKELETEDKAEVSTEEEAENDEESDSDGAETDAESGDSEAEIHIDSDTDYTEKETETSESEDKDKALIEIIIDIVEKIGNILKTPLNVLQKMQYTISRVYGKMSMIKTTLENDIFKRAFELVKGKLIKLIRMILPDKTSIDLRLGTGDPADTAQVMALYSALYPYIFKQVSFEPDFDSKVVYADAHFKGHITLFTVLYCVCVCYFNKDVKKVIKRFKKIMNS